MRRGGFTRQGNRSAPIRSGEHVLGRSPRLPRSGRPGHSGACATVDRVSRTLGSCSARGESRHHLRITSCAHTATSPSRPERRSAPHIRGRCRRAHRGGRCLFAKPRVPPITTKPPARVHEPDERGSSLTVVTEARQKMSAGLELHVDLVCARAVAATDLALHPGAGARAGLAVARGHRVVIIVHVPLIASAYQRRRWPHSHADLRGSGPGRPAVSRRATAKAPPLPRVHPRDVENFDAEAHHAMILARDRRRRLAPDSPTRLFFCSRRPAFEDCAI